MVNGKSNLLVQINYRIVNDHFCIGDLSADLTGFCINQYEKT